MSVMKNIPHPIQYQGSKRNLASFILRYAPKGIERLIEPLFLVSTFQRGRQTKIFPVAYSGPVSPP